MVQRVTGFPGATLEADRSVVLAIVVFVIPGARRIAFVKS